MSEGNTFTGIETSYILTSPPSVLVEATAKGSIENNVFALYFTPWSMNRQSSLAYLELYDLYHHYRDFTIQFFAINCEVYSTFCENQGVKVLPSFSHHFNSSIDKYTSLGSIFNLESIRSFVISKVPMLALKAKYIHESDKCLAFRRTSKRDKRAPKKDVSCVDIVRNGVSGYCECSMNDNGTSTSIKMNVSSIHKPFRCVDHCMDYFNTSLTCEDGWIETQNCTRYLNMADSQVIPQKHRSCFSKIERGVSGFCKCSGNRSVSFGCDHDDIFCDMECEKILKGNR